MSDTTIPDTIIDPNTGTIANLQATQGSVMLWLANPPIGTAYFSQWSPSSARTLASFLNVYANLAESK